jgi:DNA-binding Xre family transcriptional regulator
MTWDAYKTATIRAALSTNDEGEAKLRRDVKSFYARRNKGYFTGILNRELARTDKPFFHRWEIELLNAGEKMEKTNEMIGAVTDELRKAKQEMQDLANELVNIQEIVSVKLARQLDAIRNHRMASVRELQDILAPLKALRSFFDDGGERDAARLERLNALCSELERFHRSGALSGLVTALQVIRGTSDEG